MADVAEAADRERILEGEKRTKRGPVPLPPDKKRVIQVSTWMNADEAGRLAILC